MDEEVEDKQNPSNGKDSLLDISGGIGNDSSNSLEPGEVVEDGTPPSSSGVNFESSSDNKNNFGDNSTKVNNMGSGYRGNYTAPSKPVLGKEKAKQKLKALGIQKKIQMESKNMQTPQKRKKSRDKSGSNLRKDKPPTPHEKAKLTKEEIEKLKEKQDCAIPCLYYDANMIHHIRVECNEEKPTTSKVEPCLTASLEAIKNYEDQEDAAASGIAGERSFKRRRYADDNIRNFKQTRRKLFYSSMDTFAGRFADRGRKRVGLNRERLLRFPYRGPGLKPKDREKNERRRLSGSGPENRPQSSLPPRAYDFSKGLPPCGEDGLMYTKTKPSISFSVNPSTLATQKTSTSAERKQKKSKKRSKEHHGSHESKRKKKTKKSKNESEHKKLDKMKTKKNSEEKSEKKEKKEKKSRKTKKRLIQTRGALSFHLDEFYPVEDTESFPLCKDGVSAIDEEDDIALENKLKSLQEELNKSPSPDTDDYMANWEEEEEDFVPIPMSKDTTPKVKLREEEQKTVPGDEIKKSNDHEDDDNGGEIPILEKAQDENQCETEIKDGLSTPIFVNPSPPAELLASAAKEERDNVEVRMPEIKTSFVQGEEIENSKRHHSSPLFGMQVIYEQFIQSVSEAGIELSIEQKHPKENEVHSQQEEESSFTPNTSPGKPIIAESVLEDIKLEAEKSPSRSDPSSTPSPSSPSDSSSSSSSSSTSSAAEWEDDDTDKAQKLEKKKRTSKTSSALDSQVSVLSPEDSEKLRSLQKRWRMLKTLQEQSDAMDDEDIQCLLGLEKLIEAEKSLLMRKYDLSGKNDSSEEEEKESDAADSGAGLSSTINTSAMGSEEAEDSTTPHQEAETDADLNKIFDTNRETIKLTISAKLPKAAAKGAPIDKRSDEEEDQDFTEKLLKPSKELPLNKEDITRGGSKECRVRRYSRSPDYRRGIVRKGRSLSVSPSRRGRSQTERNRRSKRRQYSPSPRYLRLESPISRKRQRNRERKRSLSPLVRRRSRSPYGRRFSRSPPFRPPSPKSPPPSSTRDSRSLSKERSPCLVNSDSSTNHYLWSEDSSNHYYPSNVGYYYPTPPRNGDPTGQGGQQGGVRPYLGGQVYPNYPQYNVYAGDYSAMSGYANNYGNEYISSEPMHSYSRIPVINSTGANYYYNEFGTEQIQSQSHAHNIMGSRGGSKLIPQQDSPNIKSSTFVVQKGNVLEIVPTPVIPKQEPEEEIKSASTEGSSVADEKDKNDEKHQVKKEKVEEKRKKRKSVEFSSWEDEVAKRHIMSAVLRLNKESDGTLRGILCNKTNPDVQLKEKKKVLFADGIPPGKCSSTSDEDVSSPRSARKRSKKKLRRGENKENESVMLDSMDAINEYKVDPELENSPPPPPPPGSPPPNLDQPILIRPPSPEQLLYFHYDSVVNSMYVSQLATPIPPRLLNRGIPPILPLQAGTTNETSKEETSKENIKETVTEDVPPIEDVRGCEELLLENPEQQPREQKILENLRETSPVPEPQNVRQTSPSLLMQAIDEDVSVPVTRSLTPPPIGRSHPVATMDPRSVSPVVSGFSAFNRPPPRSAINVIRPNFSIPPPSAQVQTILSHPSIPFGPRPPGGTANFNRNVPPPFNPTHQHLFRPQGLSTSFNSSSSQEIPPSPGHGVMPPSTNFAAQKDCHMPPSPASSFRTSGISSPFNNSGSMPTFPNSNVMTPSGFVQKECHPSHSPTLATDRSSDMHSPFRNPLSFESTSTYSGSSNVMVSPSFTPPPPMNAKPIPILLGKSVGPSQFHVGGGNHMMNVTAPQFHGNGSQLNFNTNNLTRLPPRPFNSNGMLSQMQQHRPNLGFPRSFGPPHPHGSPHMFGGQPNHPPPPGAFSTRPRFLPSPVGVPPHFLRSDNITVTIDRSSSQRVPPNSTPPPPHPNNASPIIRIQGANNSL